MIRERSFRRRGRQVVLGELMNVVARQREDPTDGSARWPELVDVVPATVTQAALRPFERAGWIFRRRHAGAPRAPGDAAVFVAPDGRVMLGTNRLIAQLPGRPSEAEANALLRPFGCRVVERFAFAPGLFEAALTGEATGDALDVANDLVRARAARSAEPTLLEPTGPRSP